MARIIERGKAHYEAHEIPFGKTYGWHPAYVVLECDCGEKVTLTAASTTTACGRCGADHGAFVRDVREREGRSPDEDIHPWRHDARARAEQSLRDEVAHPEDSPWRYGDVTTGRTNGE